MRLAFYSPQHMGDAERIIAFCTHSHRVHVELLFTDGATFSSKMPHGVRYTDGAWLKPDNPDWDIVDLGPLDEFGIRRWTDLQVGKSYDFKGLLDFLLDHKGTPDDQWFCSELCTAALQQVGVFKHLDPCHTSPGDLWIAAMSLHELIGQKPVVTAHAGHEKPGVHGS